MSRKPYPSDVSDEEWNFVAPYLALIDEQAPQRRYSLREVFNPGGRLNPGKLLPTHRGCAELPRRFKGGAAC